MTCYYPNGALASNDIPCNANSPVSHCCNRNATCLDSGYCFGGQLDVLVRGSCTDQSFGSPSCPQRCKDVFRASQTALYYYAGVVPNSRYCCGSAFNFSTNACNQTSLNDDSPFVLPVGNIIMNRTDGATALSSPSTATTNAAISPTPPPDNNDSHTVAVGAGVGVPLGVLLIAALIALILQVRQRKRLERKLASIQESSGAANNDNRFKEAWPTSSHQLAGTPVAELPDPSISQNDKGGSTH